MTIHIHNVAKDIKDSYNKPLAQVPVSKDLPRLARKFALTKYDRNSQQFTEIKFTPDLAKDKIEQVLYALISNITELLYTPVNEQSTGGALKTLQTAAGTHAAPSQETFNHEVNLNMLETLDTYLLKYYGEEDRLIRVLKGCNQSVVIHTLYHIRSALATKEISFKDCRGEWHIDFNTGKTSGRPCVTQRRKEQVYKMSEDQSRLLNLYVFEWAISLEFDSLACNAISSVSVKFLGVDFSAAVEADVPTASRPNIEKTIRAIFEGSTLQAPELDFPL